MRIEETRAAFASRLRARRVQIEQAALDRIRALSPSSGHVTDHTDLEGAVSAAVSYGIETIESCDDQPPPLPRVLLAETRSAARQGVELQLILRRYIAGYTLLGEFVIGEAERDGGSHRGDLSQLLDSLARIFDRVVATIGEEYAKEVERGPHSTQERRAALVDRLLAGELLDASELAYDFSSHHLGLIASGPSPLEAVNDLVATLDCRHLAVPRDETTVWAWLGSRRRIDCGDLARRLPNADHSGVTFAVGEPGSSLAGWRLTHRQARESLSLVDAGTSGLTRYADVALLASIRRDELFTTSLHHLYLAPLAELANRGPVLRQTLRAYFRAGRNVSSAAAILRVNRRTVANRLHTVEECIGRSLDTCGAELDLALRLDSLNT